MSTQDDHRNRPLIIDSGGRGMRPSDWNERISEMLASFGSDHRLRYSEYVQPCIIQGEKCLVVARGLSEAHPDLFQFIMSFARKNELRIQEDRRIQALEVKDDRRSNDWPDRPKELNKQASSG